tara:strand:+ start:7264 stop:8781 length:1518 start_codon:yes stop_codon:yes gene_type:complete
MEFQSNNQLNNDSIISKSKNPKIKTNELSDEYNKIGIFTIDLSFIQVDLSLNKLVINLTSSDTIQGTSFFVPRYTRLQDNNKFIKSFINYTEFDGLNKPLSEIEIKKKQLELVTNRQSLEKYMDKFSSKFDLTSDQKNTIKTEGDLKFSVGILNTETIFENNAKFILKNVIFNNPNASFFYRIKDNKKMPSYINIDKNNLQSVLDTITFLPDRFSSKNIQDNIVLEVKNKNLKSIKKEIDKEIKNITDIYGSNKSSKTLIDDLIKRRDMLFLYLNYKIRVIQDTLKSPGINDELLNENIRNMWDAYINTNDDFKKLNIGTNFNDFSNEVKKLNREFKKMMDLRVKRNAKYKLTVIIDEKNIILVPEKPLNLLKREDREKIKIIMKDRLENLKKNCKSPGNTLSINQKKIIEMCKKICADENNCKWCDVCSTIVNCSMDENILSKCRQKKEEERKKKLEQAKSKKGGSKITKKSKKIKNKLKKSKKSKKYKKYKKRLTKKLTKKIN